MSTQQPVEIIQLDRQHHFAAQAEALRASVSSFTAPLFWDGIFRVYGAVVDEQLAGVANLRLQPKPEIPAANLRYIVVAELMRDRGIGSALIERVVEVAEAAGCQEIGINPTNDDNERLYARRRFMHVPGSNWSQMKRILSPPT
jgi:GNAT superfamily N-acetyltransferase